MNGNKCCHEDHLSKKEAKGKWTPYWVKLDGKYLKFYETNKSDKLIGSIEIGSKTKCVVSKRKTYSFPFMVCAAHGRYLFKCESAARRHMWMTAIHQAVELLKNTTTTDNIQELGLKINDYENMAVDNVEEDPNEEVVLPPHVLLVASRPDACESPSFPLKLRNRVEDTSNDIKEGQLGKASQKPKTIVYPFSRNSEELVPKISEQERRQFSSLNVRPHSPFGDTLVSPRVRSFPTTPENGIRPMSPITLDPSYFGKSRSLSSLSPSSSRTDMRFSRHMVGGGDSSELEV